MGKPSVLAVRENPRRLAAPAPRAAVGTGGRRSNNSWAPCANQMLPSNQIKLHPGRQNHAPAGPSAVARARMDPGSGAASSKLARGRRWRLQGRGNPQPWQDPA